MQIFVHPKSALDSIINFKNWRTFFNSVGRLRSWKINSNEELIILKIKIKNWQIEAAKHFMEWTHENWPQSTRSWHGQHETVTLVGMCKTFNVIHKRVSFQFHIHSVFFPLTRCNLFFLFFLKWTNNPFSSVQFSSTRWMQPILWRW